MLGAILTQLINKMKYIEQRTKTLELNEIDEFITNHIPYRIKILDTVISYPNKVNTDPLWPSIYESAQIVCRMFIQFLGLGVNGTDNPTLKELTNYYSKDGINTYEVKIKDLGFDFVRLAELTPEDINALAHAYEAGNRATAHLTYKSPFKTDHNKVIRAANIIRKIIDKKFKGELPLT